MGQSPARIVFIRPCCIGDVVLATAAFHALRDAYPDAHITWAVGGWSRQVVAPFRISDAILDTGAAALPVKSGRGFGRFVWQLRRGNYDLAVSLVRSPLMSAAVWLSGIATRAGIDSNGRGFGYNVRARVNPADRRHEAEIYLDVIAVLGVDTESYRARLPVLPDARTRVNARLRAADVDRYIVVNPAGGSNPGMTMHSKRYPPAKLATVADALGQAYDARVIVVAGPDDMPIVERVIAAMQQTPVVYAGELSFPEIGALAAGALLYLGNDTGLTHLAAASGAKTAMLMGPSDPQRYAPYTDNSIALWKPTDLHAGGVAAGQSHAWDWERDGIAVDEVLSQLHTFMHT